jgi:hypothetical protein
MPIVAHDEQRRPRLVAIGIERLAKMTWDELVAYEAFLWECMEKLPNSPTIVMAFNASHREVEYRAQDSEFK